LVGAHGQGQVPGQCGDVGGGEARGEVVAGVLDGEDVFFVAPACLGHQGQGSSGGELPLQDQDTALPTCLLHGGAGASRTQFHHTRGSALYHQFEVVGGRGVGLGRYVLGQHRGSGSPVGGEQMNVPVLLSDDT